MHWPLPEPHPLGGSSVRKAGSGVGQAGAMCVGRAAACTDRCLSHNPWDGSSVRMAGSGVGRAGAMCVGRACACRRLSHNPWAWLQGPQRVSAGSRFVWEKGAACRGWCNGACAELGCQHGPVYGGPSQGQACGGVPGGACLWGCAFGGLCVRVFVWGFACGDVPAMRSLGAYVVQGIPPHRPPALVAEMHDGRGVHAAQRVPVGCACAVQGVPPQRAPPLAANLCGGLGGGAIGCGAAARTRPKRQAPVPPAGCRR